MSGIQHRTIFNGKGGDGFIRQAQWARVITSIGTMYEPRDFGPAAMRDGFVDFDQADMMSRVDSIEGYDPMAATWGDNTVGGYTTPPGIVTSY